MKSPSNTFSDHSNTKDTIEKMADSVIQHGKLNDRIYLMSLSESDLPGIFNDLDRLAQRLGYGKILAKIPSHVFPFFKKNGYHQEAQIPDYYRKGNHCVFAAKYFSKKRRIEAFPGHVKKTMAVLETVHRSKASSASSGLSRTIEVCEPAHAQEMSLVYRSVFKSYPFPIHHPEYIKKTMSTHVDYYCIRDRGRMVALASAEKDIKNRAVEMTDFAVVPRYRGRRSAALLLSRMEEDMMRKGMRIAFTIARIYTPSMAVVFRQAGYRFAGKLTNNTHISGKIESMGVWYKLLLSESAIAECEEI